MEKKASYGLASAQEFSLPSPHPLWTKDVYDSFDVEKIPKEKVSGEKIFVHLPCPVLYDSDPQPISSSHVAQSNQLRNAFMII